MNTKAEKRLRFYRDVLMLEAIVLYVLSVITWVPTLPVTHLSAPGPMSINFALLAVTASVIAHVIR